MAYAHANRLAIAGVYFQRLLPASDYKTAVLKDELSLRMYSVSDDDYKEAQAQGLEIAQAYIPQCTALTIKMTDVFASNERTFIVQAKAMGMQVEPIESTPEDPAYMSIEDCHQLAMTFWQQRKKEQ